MKDKAKQKSNRDKKGGNRRRNQADMSIKELLDGMTEEICNHYCKFYDGAMTDEGYQELMEKRCSHCPLNVIG